MEARHSMDSPEWYTPEPFARAADKLFCGIDLDPASHAEANQIVKARSFFTADSDGLTQAWHGSVFLNPPGGLVPQFWQRVVKAYRSLEIVQAIWIGYSLEQLQSLQNVECELHPLDFSICYPRKRIPFVENEAAKIARKARCEAKGKKFNPRSTPSHGNYIAYLGRDKDEFSDCFARFGKVVIR